MDLLSFISPDILQLTVKYSAPLLIAALGELIIERSGILNLAVEGMMLMSALTGFLATYYSGSYVVGMIVAMLTTGFLGLLHGVLSVYMRANQVIVSLGILILGQGLASLLYRLFVGVALLQPQIPVLQTLHIPGLSEIPVLGKVFFQQPILVYIAYIMLPIVAFVLYRTPLGLRIRGVGENARAADTLGVDVYKIRFLCTIVGSAIIGIGGAFLPMVLTGGYNDKLVNGRGWLALILVVFGSWVPLRVFLGGLFFAYIDALQLSLAVSTKAIPSQFFLMLPYIAAIIIAVRAHRKAEGPINLLKPYWRESRGSSE